LRQFQPRLRIASQQLRNASVSAKSAKQSNLIWLTGAAFLGGIGLSFAPMEVHNLHFTLGDDANHGLHPPHYHYEHKGFFKTFDHAAIRRGFQVYKEVCSACHSIKLIAFRNLIGVSHTEDEVREICAEYQVKDGPDENGEFYMRECRLSDRFPPPYPNDEASRAANNGALPPDLSCVAKGRFGGEDYLFALLTGYHEPPPGLQVREGLHYNPYFPGGAISMARVLYDGLVEYEDGTPATTSQMAKDVSTFLAWASEPEHDDRKKMGMKAMIILSTFAVLAYWLKRYNWSYLKTRKVVIKN